MRRKKKNENKWLLEKGGNGKITETTWKLKMVRR